jgi:hypothetical protein
VADPAADRDWIDQLPRRPGPTPDTEYVQSPWDSLWHLVPRIPTDDEAMADVMSKLDLDAETLAKVSRAETERALAGYPNRRIQ